jgi:LmbE family N-acetylglucosaminyl deacetylase
MTERETAEAPAPITPGPELPEGKRVLAVFPHPDDAEFSCGGTMARWADAGNDITLCLVTDGDRGSDSPDITPLQLTETRKAEQCEAATILGIRDVLYLGRQDGTVVHDLDLRRDLTRVMRRVRPDIVICGDPSVYWHGSEYINHPDHRATADAVLAALFPSSGNRLYFPELLIEGLEPWKIHEVYLASPGQADTWVDITCVMDRKIEALRAHRCQMGEWDPAEMIREWAARDGKLHTPPVDYAEDYRYFRING